MSKIKILKRSLALVLIVVVTIGLASCKKESDKIPFGNLSDQVYAEGNNFKITEKELYEEMRISGLDILNKEIEKIVFKTEIDNIKNATGQEKESYHDELVKLANKGVFGTDDLEDLKELKEKDLKQILKTYRDATFLKGVDVYEANFDIVNFKEHDEIILEQFVVSLAKKHYAEEKLLEEVDDEDSSAYIDKDEDISNYFKNNVQKRYPLSFVSIRFQNKYEADETLRHFNIKTYRTGWFIIPNPRVEVIEDEESEAYRALDKLNLLDDNGNLSELDHQKYFNEYSIDENIDKRLDKSEALYLFFEIYNYIYPYREINLEDLENVDLEDFVENEEYVYLNPDEDEENGLFTMRYDDFPINSQSESTLTAMRNYLYNTLSTKEEETSFTTAARSFGKYYYLLYKLKDHNDDLLEQVDEDDKYQVWEDEDETILTAHAEEYYQKIVDDKLTSSYISSKASEKIKDAKVTIYDGDVHLFLGNDNYKLAKKFNNNLIAKVDDTEITVDDFYILLENQFGPSISMDLAVKKALLSSKYIDEITAEQRKEFKENIENMITQFSNNAFAQSGFPASIGRKKFLKLAFKADSIEDAVEKVYIASEIEKLYLEDYLAHYEDFYENILFYSNELLEDFFSLSTGHLIIKVDMDEDENPDDPKDFFATLADSESTKYTEEKYQEAITELLQLIHKKASKYQNFEEGLKDIVKLYNDSARFECEDVYVDPDDEDEDAKNKLCGPEKDWAKFKNLGLQIEYQSLGEQTNKTNWPGEQNFDELFYNRIVDFYQEVKEEYYDVDKAFPKQLLDDSPTKYDGVEKPVLETSFGWHLIVALGGKVGESAKYTSENDKDGDYLNIELKDEDDKVIETIDDAYSEDETISLNQLKIYLHQKDTDYGVQDLPSSVKKALTSYVDPVMAKYESKEMRLHLLYNLIKEENFKYSSSTNTEKLAKILKINQDQFLSYADEDNYPDYYRIFGDWFTKFN